LIVEKSIKIAEAGSKNNCFQLPTGLVSAEINHTGMDVRTSR